MIDVVVVNYNTCAYLRDCLSTVDDIAAAQVVVVDNASTDGSVEMVRSEFPNVRLYASPHNSGYGAAANQAVALCDSRYVLVLNSDTRLTPGALDALTTYLDANPRAAIVGPRLVNPDGSPQPTCYAFPTPMRVFLQETRLVRLIGAAPGVRGHGLRTQKPNCNRVVDWVLGAALAVRRAAFEAVSGFDETFFMYAEEVDLSYRLGQAGWETHFTPEATIVHVGGASTRQQRAAMAAQFYLSLTHFYARHYSHFRQFELQALMKAIVLMRWLRDRAKLQLAREPSQQTRLAEDLDAWQRILRSRPNHTEEPA